jgi:hypothetical protein
MSDHDPFDGIYDQQERWERCGATEEESAFIAEVKAYAFDADRQEGEDRILSGASDGDVAETLQALRDEGFFGAPKTKPKAKTVDTDVTTDDHDLPGDPPDVPQEPSEADSIPSDPEASPVPPTEK